VVVVARVPLVSWKEGHREVVAQRVDYDDDGFVELLGVPAACRGRAEGVWGEGVDGRRGACGFVGEDDAGEEEAAGEEVQAEEV
jgi:hypothetical protein